MNILCNTLCLPKHKLQSPPMINRTTLCLSSYPYPFLLYLLSALSIPLPLKFFDCIYTTVFCIFTLSVRWNLRCYVWNVLFLYTRYAFTACGQRLETYCSLFSSGLCKLKSDTRWLEILFYSLTEPIISCTSYAKLVVHIKVNYQLETNFVASKVTVSFIIFCRKKWEIRLEVVLICAMYSIEHTAWRRSFAEIGEKSSAEQWSSFQRLSQCGRSRLILVDKIFW